MRNRFRTRLTTKAVLRAVILLIVEGTALALSAMAQPVLSEDFVADIVAAEARNLGAPWAPSWFGGQELLPKGFQNFGLGDVEIESEKVEADLFFDFTGQRSRITTLDFDIFNFYGDHVSYVISQETGVCTRYELIGPMAPYFGWLASSTKLSVPCRREMVSGTTGVLWESVAAGFWGVQACLMTDMKSPYYLRWRSPQETPWMLFKTYLPGRPDPSNFDLPDGCSE